MKSAFADPSTFEPGYALIYRTKAESDTLSTYIPIDQCTTNGPGYGIIFHAMARIQHTMQRMSRVHAGGCFPPKGQVCYNRGDPEAKLGYDKLETKHHRSRPTLRVPNIVFPFAE